LYNYSILEMGRVRLAVGVPLDCDLAKASQALASVAAGDERIRPSQTPIVNVVAVGDAAITLELVVYMSDLSGTRALRSTLLERTINTFRAQGLKLMEPHAPPDAGRGPWTE